MTRREYFDSLARALLPDVLSRSQRISNLKLKSVSNWTPKYPSVRDGWPIVVAGLSIDSGSAAA